MRGINPLRPLMFWDRDVRGCPALFESYRARMRALVQEVRALGMLLPTCGRPRKCSRAPAAACSQELRACAVAVSNYPAWHA